MTAREVLTAVMHILVVAFAVLVVGSALASVLAFARYAGVYW